MKYTNLFLLIFVSWFYYPELRPLVYFELWHSAAPTMPGGPGWSIYATTTNLFVTVAATNSAEFFAVRAVNSTTGETSDWGTK